MVELNERLLRCFSLVFPTLAETEILSASGTFLSDMDSLTGVTLITLIGEEFGVDLEFDGLLELGTFEAIREYLRSHSPSTLPATNG